MGVPKLFKIILDKFPKSHSKINPDIEIEYLLIDFNSIIYESYEKIKSDLQKERKSPHIETDIIRKTIEITKDMINDVKPTKLVYLALDGTPPRGKMVEQRNRRYKKLYADHIISQIKQKYKEETKNGGTSKEVLDEVEPSKVVEEKEKDSWDTTNISPGTVFMDKISRALHKAIMEKIFSGQVEYVMSDTSVPGEGEQKFLPYMDTLKPGSKICIYSNDGDILILVARFPQHQIHILTRTRDSFDKIQKLYANEKYFYIDVTEIDIGFLKSFSKLNPEKYISHRLKLDFAFYSMLGGNDFVKHLFFLKMKEEHSPKILFGVYQALIQKHGYLINEDFTINHKFILDYLRTLAKQEAKWSRKIQDKYQNHDKKKNEIDKLKAIKLKPWEIEWEIFQHTPYYKENHPQFQQFKEQFYKINFYDKTNVWKKQYYKTFFNINYDNKKLVNKICFQYLQSLIYCWLYYFKSIPSWRYHYPHSSAPLPSDLVYTLYRIKDINTTFKFTTTKYDVTPYKPFEQLMLILPNKNSLLPPELKKIQRDLPQYYPSGFKLDVLWGQKFIYAEPDLPELNDKEILSKVHKTKLKAEDQKRNTLHTNPLYYPL